MKDETLTEKIQKTKNWYSRYLDSRGQKKYEYGEAEKAAMEAIEEQKEAPETVRERLRKVLEEDGWNGGYDPYSSSSKEEPKKQPSEDWILSRKFMFVIGEHITLADGSGVPTVRVIDKGIRFTYKTLLDELEEVVVGSTHLETARVVARDLFKRNEMDLVSRSSMAAAKYRLMTGIDSSGAIDNDGSTTWNTDASRVWSRDPARQLYGARLDDDDDDDRERREFMSGIAKMKER